MRKLIPLSIFLISVFFYWNCKPDQDQSEDALPKKPNFVIIFTDELQFDDISCYGGQIPTPNIDQLASEGLRFDKAYTTSSMCTPSRFGLITGTYPGRCSHPSFIKGNPKNESYSIAWNTWLDKQTVTFPKVLQAHGYVTGMAGKWHICEMPDSVELPALLAADNLDDPDVNEKLGQLQGIYTSFVKELGGFDVVNSLVWGNFDGHKLHALRFHNFPWMTHGALDFLDAYAGGEKPFMLYLAPTAIHGPNHVRDLDLDCSYTLDGKRPEVLAFNLDTDSVKQQLAKFPGKGHRYAGMAQIDYQLKRVREKLEEKGVADNTVIIFMADHNIEPGKATSFEKGIHVPMIVYMPEVTSGRSSDALVQNIDIFPTLMDLAGIEPGKEMQLDGVSFSSVLKDPTAEVRKYIYAENGYTRAISDGKLKYIALRYPGTLIEAMESGESDHVPSYVKTWPQADSAIAMHAFPNYFDQDHLYDLLNDPYEVINLVNDKDLATAQNRLRDAMLPYLNSFDHPYSLEPIAFMESLKYDELSEHNLDWDLTNIPWVRRDHGEIVWPPK